jgi:hypothetical protein
MNSFLLVFANGETPFGPGPELGREIDIYPR